MFCPNCRTEYRSGFTVCADCGVSLVSELPPKPHDESDLPGELVTVFESYNHPDIAIARSILDDAGIGYLSNDLAEAYPVAPVSFQVKPDDAEEAKALLADLAKGSQIAEQNGLEEEEGDTAEQAQN